MSRFACAKVPRALPLRPMRQFDVIPVFLNSPAIGIVSSQQTTFAAVVDRSIPKSCISQYTATRLRLNVTPVPQQHHHTVVIGHCQVGVSLFAQIGQHGVSEISSPIDLIDVEVVPVSYIGLNFSPPATAVSILLGSDFIGRGKWTGHYNLPSGAVLACSLGCRPFP